MRRGIRAVFAVSPAQSCRQDETQERACSGVSSFNGSDVVPALQIQKNH
jgi:hypothetical protein